MAKTTRKAASPTPTAVASAAPDTRSLAAYAEALGTAMGNLRNRVDDWQGQRTQLVNQLSTMVTDAQALLSDLGHNATERIGKLRRGKRKAKKVLANAAGGLKPEKRAKSGGLTEAGRAAISAAQKRRWAQYKNKRVPK